MTTIEHATVATVETAISKLSHKFMREVVYEYKTVTDTLVHNFKWNCVSCGRANNAALTDYELNAWMRDNKLIQVAMPNVSGTFREGLLTGMCNFCVDELHNG